MHRFPLTDQKLNSQGLFRALVVTHLFQFQFLSTRGNVMFVQNSISYKKVCSENGFQLINRKLKLKGLFRHLVVASLFKIQFSTKHFSAKYFIKIHRIHLILKEVFRPLVLHGLLTLPTGNAVAPLIKRARRQTKKTTRYRYTKPMIILVHT